MASETLMLEVATPLGMALRVECESVSAPSVYGEFGVLPGHLPLLAALRAGLLRYTVDGKVHIAAVGPGFVSAGPRKVDLLTDVIARPEDIDREAAEAELKAADEALGEYPELYEGPDYDELQRGVDWAVARIDAAAAAER